MQRPLVTDNRVEKALTFLAETDVECAQLKAQVARTEYLAKVAESLAFKLASGNNEERKAEARTAPEVREAWEAHFSAMKDFESKRARREREMLVIDVYRTISANRRMGGIQ